MPQNPCEKEKIQNEPKCVELRVHDDKMGESTQEKYLGDLINNSGTNRKTIEDRRNKGYGIVSEIIAILEEIPLGRFKHEIGLKLRQAMFLNGILFNTEAWHSVTEEEIKMLETVDEHLLRALVKGQSKTPLEFLYLEAGAIPIRFLFSRRRLMYHQVILQREDNELTKRVYSAQKADPVKGDFVKLLEKDFEMISEEQDDEKITTVNSMTYKKDIKSKIRAAAFKMLKARQQEQS